MRKTRPIQYQGKKRKSWGGGKEATNEADTENLERRLTNGGGIWKEDKATAGPG